MASSSGQAIKFEMLVGVDGLIEGLKVATKGVEQSAQAIKLGLGSTGAAARSAAKEHEGFTSTLRNFKSEQVQGGRVARYYADQIASIIPEAAGAQSALRGVLEVATGGLGIGAAIGAALVVFGQFSEATKAAEKHAKDLRAAYLSTSLDIQNSFRDLARELEGPISKTAAIWRSKIDQIRGDAKKLTEGASVGDLGWAAQFIGTGKEVVRSFKEALIGRGPEEPAANSKEAAVVQEKVQAVEDQKVKRDQSTWDELIHHATEAARKFRAIRLQNAVEQDALNDRIAQTAKRQREEESTALDRIGEVDKKNREDELGLIQKVADAADNLAKKERLAVEDLAGSIASQWSGLVQGMLTGAVSFADGLKSVFDSILQSFTQMIIQMALKAAILKIFDFIAPGGGTAINALNSIASGGSIFGGVASGGGGPALAMAGGGGLSINISAMDGASVMRVVESPGFARAISEARRNGKL